VADRPLTLSSAIIRTSKGLAMITFPTWGISSRTIAIVLPVASSTTSSSGFSVRAMSTDFRNWTLFATES
jgi:hypothetical protein